MCGFLEFFSQKVAVFATIEFSLINDLIVHDQEIVVAVRVQWRNRSDGFGCTICNSLTGTDLIEQPLQGGADQPLQDGADSMKSAAPAGPEQERKSSQHAAAAFA